MYFISVYDEKLLNLNGYIGTNIKGRVFTKDGEFAICIRYTSYTESIFKWHPPKRQTLLKIFQNLGSGIQNINVQMFSGIKNKASKGTRVFGLYIFYISISVWTILKEKRNTNNWLYGVSVDSWYLIAQSVGVCISNSRNQPYLILYNFQSH